MCLRYIRFGALEHIHHRPLVWILSMHIYILQPVTHNPSYPLEWIRACPSVYLSVPGVCLYLVNLVCVCVSIV